MPERKCERCGAELPTNEYTEVGTPAAFVRIVFPTALVVMAICERCAESYGAWSKRLADIEGTTAIIGGRPIDLTGRQVRIE